MSEAMAVENVSKHFPPNIVALDQASLDVRRGEVHCLLGANGAGKSTLLKIVAGAIQPTAGTLRIDGRNVQMRSPAEAAQSGVSMIYQELDLVPQMTVEQNLYLGQEPRRMGVVDTRARRRGALKVLERVGARFDPGAAVESLSIANRQLTAIARSLTRDARIIIMDEPSGPLNESELDRVFTIIRELTAEGVAIIYVSHRLEELQEIGDRVTVLRGGRTVDTFDVAGTDSTTLVHAVVGENRTLIERKPRPKTRRDTALRIERLSGADGLDIGGLEVGWGEIAGLTGLNGAGRTSLLRSLFGVRTFTGSVHLDGAPYKPRSPAAAIARGVGLVPDDRKIEGLILDAPVYANTTLPLIRGRVFANHGRRRTVAADVLQKLSTKYGHADQKAIQLSGGNQQKVVLAKWVVNGSKLLLLDEPSRGLDVGAKADLYELVTELADKGAAIIISSSELDELHAHCDRIWVLYEGRLLGQFDPETTDQSTILKTQILGEIDV